MHDGNIVYAYDVFVVQVNPLMDPSFIAQDRQVAENPYMLVHACCLAFIVELYHRAHYHLVLLAHQRIRMYPLEMCHQHLCILFGKALVRVEERYPVA